MPVMSLMSPSGSNCLPELYTVTVVAFTWPSKHKGIALYIPFEFFTNTKLTILALVPIENFQMFAISFFVCTLADVKSGRSGYGCNFHWFFSEEFVKNSIEPLVPLFNIHMNDYSGEILTVGGHTKGVTLERYIHYYVAEHLNERCEKIETYRSRQN